MAQLSNGRVNGHANGTSQPTTQAAKRFAHIPNAIEVPVAGFDEAVELDLVDLNDDVTELCTLLDNENASKTLWLTVALAYAKQYSLDLSIEIVNRGLQSLSRAGPQKEKIGLLSLLCWLYLWKTRISPMVVAAPVGGGISEVKTKAFYLQAATGALNDALRVQPQFPPLFLARGVLSLLNAAQQSSTSVAGPTAQSERGESLRQALRSFEDASKVSAGRNMMAVLGKARTFFAMKRFEDSYKAYQDVLSRMPDMVDPDPRIGIGCCLWQLNHPEEARVAWQRALDLNPASLIAKTLIGICGLRDAKQLNVDDPSFSSKFRQAISDLVQKTAESDRLLPLACVHLGSYLFDLQDRDNAETLAKKALALTDTTPIASDAWYTLAQTEHSSDIPDWARVEEFYNRSDGSRAGEKGFLSAKLGSIQANISTNRKTDARFRLEKLVQQNGSNLEAKVILGSLYAEEVFNDEMAMTKEDKSSEYKKALAHLEAVRVAWKDPKRNFPPDVDLLLTLAKLYGTDVPDKALQCLEEVKKILLDNLAKDEDRVEVGDKEQQAKQQVECLPSQFLNNIGCHQFQLERFESAIESFQSALNACTGSSTDDGNETDALITTISYNLARSYEASQLYLEARKVYQGLLERHPDYVDAQARLAYLTYAHHDAIEGTEAIEALYNSNTDDLDIRALYGWYLNQSKKFSPDPAQDVEQRHHKHTLQQFDKHDIYALTAMGNINLKCAREMPRDTDSRRERRRKVYETAFAFFKRVLDLDSKNVFAAQGIAIALVEDQKNLNDALPVFLKAKEIIRDSSTLVNLGHAFAEKKDLVKSIEHFEVALSKGRGDDPIVLSAIGRVHFYKGRQEKSLPSMQTALHYARQALELAHDDIYYKFNVAYVQIQISGLVPGLPEQKRTVDDIETAIAGLDEAIAAFSEIAKAKHPPYPRQDLEQRASMGRTTIRRQLDRALQAQKDYETANAAKVAETKRIRGEAQRKREEEIQRIEAEKEIQKQKLTEGRQKLADQAREMAERRLQEARHREEAEYTEDSDGNRIKRVKIRRAGGKRKKKGDDDIISDGDASDAPRRRTKRATPDDGDENAPKKKKRKLARKNGSKANSKYKSAATISDSDEELAGLETAATNGQADSADESDAPRRSTQVASGDVSMNDAEDDEDEAEVIRPPQRKKQLRTIADDEDDEDEDEGEMAQNFAEPPVNPVQDNAGAARDPNAGIASADVPDLSD